MAGWVLTLYALPPKVLARAMAPIRVPAMLARWNTSFGGLDWIEQLGREGKATPIDRSNIDITSSGTAGDILPLLANGPPSPVKKPRRRSSPRTQREQDGQFFRERMEACPPDKIVTLWAVRAP